MAYKFQRGEAILSGALLQEGNIEIEEGFSFSMHEQTIVDTSRNLTVAGISGSGNLQAGRPNIREQNMCWPKAECRGPRSRCGRVDVAACSGCQSTLLPRGVSVYSRQAVC